MYISHDHGLYTSWNCIHALSTYSQVRFRFPFLTFSCFHGSGHSISRIEHQLFYLPSCLLQIAMYFLYWFNISLECPHMIPVSVCYEFFWSCVTFFQIIYIPYHVRALHSCCIGHALKLYTPTMQMSIVLFCLLRQTVSNRKYPCARLISFLWHCIFTKITVITTNNSVYVFIDLGDVRPGHSEYLIQTKVLCFSLYLCPCGMCGIRFVCFILKASDSTIGRGSAF